MLHLPDTATACVWLSSSGFTTTGWASGTLAFKSNVSSLNSALSNNGLSLSSTQYEWWVNYAISNWRERTGANMTVTYNGTSSKACGVSGDSENTVAGQATCLEPGCTTWAQTVWSFSTTSPNPMVEADICVYGNSATWRVRLDQLSGTSNKDFVGVLVHEFGHALGLNHTSQSVMDSPTFNTGNALARYPYADDVACIIGSGGTYGSRSLSLKFIQRVDNSSWSSSSTTIPTLTTDMHPSGAIARYGTNGSKFLYARHGTNRQVYYARTPYPPYSGSTWDDYTLGSGAGD